MNGLNNLCLDGSSGDSDGLVGFRINISICDCGILGGSECPEEQNSCEKVESQAF